MHIKNNEYSVITPKLIKLITDNYKLDIYGRHGINHWARVRYNGLLLAKNTDINIDVIEYFSVLHDSQRITEKLDKNHGKKSAEFISKIRESHINLNDSDFKRLFDACYGHNHIKFHTDLTVQICWDADRLDLLRAGIRPSPDYMSTKLAKCDKTIEQANKRSIENYIPDIIKEWEIYKK